MPRAPGGLWSMSKMGQRLTKQMAAGLSLSRCHTKENPACPYGENGCIGHVQAARSIFTFIVRWRPLEAIVIMMSTKVDVRRCRSKKEKVGIGEMDG